ncbi:MAG TPA: hypothetical protein VKT80_07135, partial [Chloroflexota bacterium]|nr:hypothetical protein [Chloroflexota bacterium]
GLSPNIPLQFGIPTIDGYDGGILPLDRYHDLKRLFPAPGRDVADGRLRLQLVSAPATDLLAWLNIRFLVMDRLRDRWFDGTYYDLALSQTLAPGDTILLPVQPTFLSSAIGIVIEKVAGPGPTGNLRLATGDTAVDINFPGVLPPDADFPDPTDSRPLELRRVGLSPPSAAQEVQATWTGDSPIVLRSVSLVGTAPGVERSVPVDRRLRLSYLGDMKIYDNQMVRPRAFLANGLSVVASSDAVVRKLNDSNWDAGDVAVASQSDVRADLAFSPTAGPGSVRILVDEPENMVVATDEPAQKVLVITDTSYPGWRATVDGVDVPTLVVDVMFRGLIVPPGSHVVEYRYDPLSWRIGVILSAVGFIVWIVGLFKLTPRRTTTSN